MYSLELLFVELAYFRSSVKQEAAASLTAPLSCQKSPGAAVYQLDSLSEIDNKLSLRCAQTSINMSVRTIHQSQLHSLCCSDTGRVNAFKSIKDRSYNSPLLHSSEPRRAVF